MNVDRIQPHQEDAEEALLGCFLLDSHYPAHARPSEGLAWLQPRMFWQRRHATIFGAMQGVLARGMALDVITVGHALDEHGTWDEVGGGGYLLHLVNRVPTPLHAVHYARIVKECWERRQQIRKGVEMVQQGVNPKGRPNQGVPM